ncbi:MAG TPA: methyltransferase domain-containing protein [Streptomyces sp.]
MNWRARAEKLADQITPVGSRWRDAVLSTRRHLLVPHWWWSQEGGGRLADGPEDPGLWARAAYSDTTLVTRLGPLHADHATVDDRPEWRPTSSATHPSLVIKMLRHTRASEGMDVLDVGTASGYSTALLAHRFGDRHVTSVDVDPYLTDTARSRLAEIGRKPEIVHVDATEELPGTYDRIVAMVAMPRVPASWLTALRPGGRLVTTLAGTTLIISAEKTPDGGAVGRVERDWAGFMNARHGPTFPPRLITAFPGYLDQEGEEITTGRYPVLDVAAVWEIGSLLTLEVPGIETHYEESYEGRRTAWLFHPDGSWARATAHGHGVPQVHQAGPRRLWSTLESIRESVSAGGVLQLFDATVVIKPDGVCHLSYGQWSATVGA